MTAAQKHVEAIQKFGYTERQAAFLYLVAMHSGYFIARQYDAHIGQVNEGGNRKRFLDHVTKNTHAKPLPTADKTALFHLSSKPLYQAIGATDNRNRRARPTFQIRLKLMTLDFVLAHPTARFLTTERERVQYFTQDLRIPLTALPTKHYVSKKSQQSKTARHFVDKNPIFLSSGTEGAAPVVSFVYVDAGSETAAGFRTYLAQYRRLFDALKVFRVLYVGTRQMLFGAARREFEKVVLCPHGDRPSVERLLAHFEQREPFERKDISGFTTETMKQYLRERKAFTGVRYDALYEVFQREGKAAFLARFDKVFEQADSMGMADFETYLLPDRYGFMGVSWAS